VAFTITNKTLKVNGKTVAHIPNDRAFRLLLTALAESLPNMESVFLAVAYLGSARTSDIAEFVGLDRANTGKLLDALAEEGSVKVATVDNNGKPGRPSRVWEVAK